MLNNYIGTDVTGMLAREQWQRRPRYPPTEPSSRDNVIAANSGYGINASSDSNITIAGNTIGLNAAGASSLVNTDQTVNLGNTSGAMVGGTTAGDGNVVNAASGKLPLNLSNASGTTVYGNLFGTNAAGSAVLSGAGFQWYFQFGQYAVWRRYRSAREHRRRVLHNRVHVTGASSAGTQIQRQLHRYRHHWQP